MSYNGIGLNTPRGSGTNGYVQRNISSLFNDKKGESQGKHFSQRRLKEKYKLREMKERKMADQKVDKDILDHERKRKLEIKVMEYRDKLEEENDDDDQRKNELDDKEIDAKVKAFRERLLAREVRINKNKMDKNYKKGVSYNTKINPFGGNKPTAAADTDADADSVAEESDHIEE